MMANDHLKMLHAAALRTDGFLERELNGFLPFSISNAVALLCGSLAGCFLCMGVGMLHVRFTIFLQQNFPPYVKLESEHATASKVPAPEISPHLTSAQLKRMLLASGVPDARGSRVELMDQLAHTRTNSTITASKLVTPESKRVSFEEVRQHTLPAYYLNVPTLTH